VGQWILGQAVLKIQEGLIMRSIAIVVTFCLIACAVVSAQALADGYERLIKSRQELLGDLPAIKSARK